MWSDYFDTKRGQSLIRTIESAQGNALPDNNRQTSQSLTKTSVNVYVEEGDELKPDPNIKIDPTYVINYEVCKCGKHEAIQLRELIESYPETVARQKYDIGIAKVEPVDINTTTDIPVKSKFLRIPYKLREEVANHEKAMREAGVMIKSDTPWRSSWVIVNKKDATKRPCIDFRELNAVTVTDPYPLPRIDGLLETIAGCHWYSALDLCNGYQQLVSP